MSERIFIYGGGGHAKVVLDSLQQQDITVEAIVDTKFSGDLLGVRRIAELPADLKGVCKVIIAIGDNRARQRISTSLGFDFTTAIDVTCTVSRHAAIGEGSMIIHRSIVQAGAKVGSHVIINTNAQIDHDCVIGNFVHIAPGAVLCGNVSVGEGTLIGAGAVIKPGVKIGSWVTVGCGAVVVKDLPDNAVAVGSPARIIKYNPQ
jgi:sugar O-acyltransferase (sialic acid O-acetyltransferase NeuD family)